MRIVVVNSNPIHRVIEEKAKVAFGAAVINQKSDLSQEALQTLAPDYVFFLHWSYIVSEEIFSNYTCIVFHMTDLPYGRGGSPLQNLIVRKHVDTMLSAIRMEKGIDTGPIYLKKKLTLEGSAKEIFIRAGALMFEMMQEIITTRPTPVPQVGTAVNFKRRTPEDGDLSNVHSLQDLYDFIRMLDADNYPPAFLEIGDFRLEFSHASLKDDKVIAEVVIRLK